MNVTRTVAHGATWLCVEERVLCDAECSAPIDFFRCLYFALNLIWMALIVYNCYLMRCIFWRVMEIPLPKPRSTTPCKSTTFTDETLLKFTVMPLPGLTPSTRTAVIGAHDAEKQLI